MYKKSNFRSHQVALVGILCVLLGTTRHNWVVYMETTGAAPNWYTMVYVGFMLLAIDAAVVVFALHGNRGAAQTFAWLIGVMNLYYFWSHQDYPETGLDWFRLLPGLLYAGMFAYALYYFTEIFVGFIEADERLVKAQADRDAFKARLIEAENARKEIQLEAEKARKEAERAAALNQAALDESPVFQDLQRRYQAALALVAEAREIPSKSRENIRATASHYRRKIENPDTSPEKAAEAAVILDAISSFN